MNIPDDVKTEVLDAEKRIRPYVLETPLEYSRYLSNLAKATVYLKLENTQHTGSFKFRGAANHMLSLSEEQLDRGLVTASTGNHGAAFAEMLEILGRPGMIYLPKTASQAKIDVLKSYRVNLMFVGEDCEIAEKAAADDAKRNNRIFVPPYNHPKIVGGQGTIAVELERRLDTMDAVLVPIGGGGLMGGIAGYLKATNPSTQCIGCQPAHSPIMFESVKAGKIVEMESKPTLSDGTAGGMEADSITFDICKECVDDYVVVSEEEIAGALRLMLEKHYMLVEGAAALSVASFLKTKDQYKGKTVVLIISGKKMPLDKLKTVICH